MDFLRRNSIENVTKKHQTLINHQRLVASDWDRTKLICDSAASSGSMKVDEGTA